MSFEQFTEKQIAEIEAAIASGIVSDPEEWIEKNAEQFRSENPVDE